MASPATGGGRRPRVLVGVTGSVASIKLPLLVRALEALPAHVRIVTTDRAEHFFAADTLGVPVLRDADEWKSWAARGDPVVHIELRKWADVFVIAPLDANTLAKIAGGMCDNLLTCVARAWDFKRPFVVCPAMNTMMWEHPLTHRQLDTLASFGCRVVDPIQKTLVCGDTGSGAMAEVDTIASAVRALLPPQADMPLE